MPCQQSQGPMICYFGGHYRCWCHVLDLTTQGHTVRHASHTPRCHSEGRCAGRAGPHPSLPAGALPRLSCARWAWQEPQGKGAPEGRWRGRGENQGEAAQGGCGRLVFPQAPLWCSREVPRASVLRRGLWVPLLPPPGSMPAFLGP